MSKLYYQHPVGEPLCFCENPTVAEGFPLECFACMRLLPGPGDDPYASPEAQEHLHQVRAASHRKLQKLSTADRFRLMFGQPLLPQPDYNSSIQETNERASTK